MRWSRLLLNTLRESPQEAEITSHKLMLRAGLIRRLAGGLYTFMPLGLRALRKVERIVREEMDRAGALEILMPALQPGELWDKSGRYDTMGESMFRLRDRNERRMVLGPTHEEVVTSIAAHEINSYRQLPCTLYQIQTKFRDELRPRFGLMRAKEFIMKDAYSFDVSLEAADASYKAMYDAYRRVFSRCGLETRAVEADTGAIGGNWSHEFMVMAEAGEDSVLVCPGCDYAANQERAERRQEGAKDSGCREATPQEVATPGKRTIEEVSAFLRCDPDRLIKTIICVADGKPVAALVPGNRELNINKLKRALGAETVDLADDETVEQSTGAPVGFAGPQGLKIPVYADLELEGASDRIAGANKDETHTLHIDLARDADVKGYFDLVIVEGGDGCPHCDGNLHERRGIEVGHVFKLGTTYAEALEAKFMTEEGGAPSTCVMGCYGIGITRTLQAVIEQSHDDDGILWPVSVAPFAVALLLLDPKETEVAAAAAELERELEARGLDVLVDDRLERPGVKFKDADLIGLPFRVVVGAKALAKGSVEIRRRGQTNNELIPLQEAVEWLASEFNKSLELTE